MPHTLILFPGALGDFLCLWPALQGIRQRTDGRLTVVARAEVACLLPADRFDFVSIDRHEIADLFADTPLAGGTRALFAGFDRIHSWTGFGESRFARRLEIATGGLVSLHRFRGMRMGEHAAAYYARCVDVTPGSERLVSSEKARMWAEQFWTRYPNRDRVLVIHAGSGSARKNWEGMREMADWWQTSEHGSVLSIAGPVEVERQVEMPSPDVLRAVSLEQLGALLTSALYLGNDSGVSHLAGLVGARGVVVFGPTDPVTWHPLGDGLHVLSAVDTCAHCDPETFCVHRLPAARVRTVLAAFAHKVGVR